MSEDSGQDSSQKQEGGGAPAWMVTFGDLMALLLCFFVLLLSFSEMDVAKYKEVTGSLEKAFGVQRKTPEWDSPKGTSLIARNFDRKIQVVQPKQKRAGDKLEEELENLFRVSLGRVEGEITEGKISIRLVGGGNFRSGEAEILPDFIAILERLGRLLKQISGEVIIAGHTDNVPLKSGSRFKNNLLLSMARSAAVAEFFITRGHLSENRVVTMGFGEFHPVDSNDTEQGRRKNRRVEIILARIPENQPVVEIKEIAETNP